MDIRFPSKKRTEQVARIFVLICLAGGLIWEVPRRQVAVSRNRLTAKEAIDAETAARNGWSQLLVGSFVAFGALTAWRTYQFNVAQAEKNFQILAEKQDQDAAHAEKNFQAVQEKNTADRFSRAVEMLGNKEQITVRLGGIYSLARIAKDSPEDYHWIIMELLSAFVREKAPFPHFCNSAQLAEAKKSFSKPIEKDIQAVLTVLGHRENRNFELSALKLTGICLCCANFSDTDLTGVNFSFSDLGRSNFSNANLRGALFHYTCLEEAILWDADLDQASFSVAFINRASFDRARNLSAEHIKSAVNWDTAFYDNEFRQQLGLSQHPGHVSKPSSSN